MFRLAAWTCALTMSAALCAQRNHHGSAKDFWKLVESACGPKIDGEAPPFSNMFGYAIGRSMAAAPTEEQLELLAATMRESRASGRLDDPKVPAGLIFLGQFIDHDITLEATSRLAEASSPDGIENLRSPRLDLDSVYLDGPEGSAFLYDRDRHGHLLVGTDSNELDLPRNRQNVALIGDPRNDENTIISQLHLLFVRFHNAVITDVEAGVFDGFRRPGEGDFDCARRIVRWHYQWIVRHEFLPAVVQQRVLDAVQADINRKGWCATGEIPNLPIEFSAAAYRFGHSQIRGSLRVKRRGDEFKLFPPGNALPFFTAVAPEHTVDWSLYFRSSLARPQPARKLDTFLAEELFTLFGGTDVDAQLATRNLKRGSLTFDLSTGEEAVAFFNTHGAVIEPLPTPPAVTELGLAGTPLWYYSLYEAELGGGKLGDVGGRIVAITLLRMLNSDPERIPDDVLLFNTAEASEASFPFLGGQPGWFGMADLVRYVEASEGR